MQNVDRPKALKPLMEAATALNNPILQKSKRETARKSSVFYIRKLRLKLLRLPVQFRISFAEQVPTERNTLMHSSAI